MTRLDYPFLVKVFLGVGVLLAVVSPLSRDPIAFAAGGMVPALAMWLIGRPTMPAAVIYLVLWQWAQTFARILQTLADGESLGAACMVPIVERAYWYMLASVVTLALAFRLVLGRLPPPTPELRIAHTRWQPQDLVILYLGTSVLSIVARYRRRHVERAGAADAGAAISQGAGAVPDVHIVLMTGKGGKFVADRLPVRSAVRLHRPALRLQGRLHPVRACRPGGAHSLDRHDGHHVSSYGWRCWWRSRCSGPASRQSIASWRRARTSSQAIRASLGDRLGYLGSRALLPIASIGANPSYALLIRFAYVDIFGSVIGVQEASPEQGRCVNGATRSAM